jgi:hypothetical protein
MRVASFIADNARLDAYYNPRTLETCIIVETPDGSVKINFKNGQQLAMFLRFAAQLLTNIMKKAGKSREEIIDAVQHHAKAGAYEELQDMPVQTTLEGML